MSYPTLRTTIDQHNGTHEPTGLPIFALKEITTDLSPYADRKWDDLSADDQTWWTELTEQYHAACVALESLDSDVRERAKELLAETETDHLDDQAGIILRAIEEAKAETAAKPTCGFYATDTDTFCVAPSGRIWIVASVDDLGSNDPVETDSLPTDATPVDSLLTPEECVEHCQRVESVFGEILVVEA